MDDERKELEEKKTEEWEARCEKLYERFSLSAAYERELIRGRYRVTNVYDFETEDEVADAEIREFKEAGHEESWFPSILDCNEGLATARGKEYGLKMLHDNEVARVAAFWRVVSELPAHIRYKRIHAHPGVDEDDYKMPAKMWDMLAHAGTPFEPNAGGMILAAAQECDELRTKNALLDLWMERPPIPPALVRICSKYIA